MKFNRKLIAAFACLSVVFGACTDTPDVDCGVKANLTAPGSVTWDAGASSKTALALTWDASSAIAAGASSFTAQVVRPNMDTMEEGELHDFITPDQYSSSSVVLLATSNYLGSPNIDANETACDQILFDGLATGKQYMLRVRANYPGSNYSEWVWVTDEAGELAHIKVGKGIVAPTELDDKMPPVVKISYVSAADAIVTWSCADWKNHSADFGMEYILTLNKGSELVVKYHFSANSAVWSSYARNGCAFCLTALEPDTEYNVTVQNVTEGTEPVSPTTFKTEASKVVTMPSAPANAGDVILYEDFAELILTADLSRGAAGISSGIRNTADGTWKPTGDLTHILDDDNSNTVATDANPLAWYLCEPSTEVGMFNTIKGLIANSRLATWGMMAEDDTKGAICARAGHVKMGASKMCAWLVAPEINCLQQTATVELSFDAALYESDPGTAIVEVLNGCTQADNASNSFVTPADRMTAATFDVAKDWTRYTFTIDNINNGARIAIGGNRNGVSGQHRFYLDNIEIKVVSYGDLKLQAPKNVEIVPTDTTAEVTWDKVNSAEQYVVEYTNICDACGQPIWTALPATAETKATIEGLSFETEYSVRIKAIAGEVKSEYCEPVPFKTLAEIKTLKTPKDVVATAGLTTIDFTFPAVTKATDYEVYNGETKLTSSFVEAEKVVTVTVTGLAMETSYNLAIKAVAPGTDMEASELTEAISAKTGKMFEYRSAGLEYNPTTLVVEWTDYRAGHDYTISLAKADGSVLGTWDVTFGASSLYYGKGESKVCPARFTFPALTPASTYKVSVKSKGADDSAYTTVEFSTSAARVATAKDVLWNGFDDCILAGDSHNIASSFLVKDKATALATVWPVTEDYVYGTMLGKIGTCSGADNSGQILNPAIADVNCSLYGYTFAAVEMHPGFLKVGAGITIGVVTTNVLGDKVLKADAASACTVEFKVSPRTDTNLCAAKVKLVVVHADGTETVAASGLDVLTNEDPLNYTWRKHTVKDVQLLSTDKIRVAADTDTASGPYRFHLDDILVVAQ